MQKSRGGFRYKDEGTRTIAHKSAVQHRSAPRKPLTRKHKCPAFLLAVDAQIRASRAERENCASDVQGSDKSIMRSAVQPTMKNMCASSVAQSADGGVFAWMDESDRSAGATSLPWSPLECKLLGGAPKQSIYDFFRRSAKAESADDSSGAPQPTATRSDERASPDTCLLYTSPSPRDVEESRMPSSA